MQTRGEISLDYLCLEFRSTSLLFFNHTLAQQLMGLWKYNHCACLFIFVICSYGDYHCQNSGRSREFSNIGVEFQTGCRKRWRKHLLRVSLRCSQLLILGAHHLQPSCLATWQSRPFWKVAVLTLEREFVTEGWITMHWYQVTRLHNTGWKWLQMWLQNIFHSTAQSFRVDNFPINKLSNLNGIEFPKKTKASPPHLHNKF